MSARKRRASASFMVRFRPPKCLGRRPGQKNRRKPCGPDAASHLNDAVTRLRLRFSHWTSGSSRQGLARATFGWNVAGAAGAKAATAIRELREKEENSS